ncbi:MULTISPECIES: hypothetical protein [unclassified Pseudomonas]|uniref:hypothetical protein n=1 Tax=unclassified Pseudomonas TaxID=196821 RepID=UPI002096856E|nr:MULTISPECIES: hypothetical protein [unclassified Pseudomonas]MCO7518115.1 hypothetical protein [Pseudomonas sp. 1]MCO7541576.1 hypothetical protein [Pseudomonas sp. VA159-2]
MRLIPLICLVGSLTVLGGCFDRDNDHPGKDSDPSKPSLQMQQPAAPATPQEQPPVQQTPPRNQ